MKCFKCQGAHHVAICDSFADTVSGPEQVENVPNVSTSLYVDQYRGSVLLQTATAEVVRPDNDSSPLNVRLVFDSCSQRSRLATSRPHDNPRRKCFSERIVIFRTRSK